MTRPILYIPAKIREGDAQNRILLAKLLYTLLSYSTLYVEHIQRRPDLLPHVPPYRGFVKRAREKGGNQPVSCSSRGA